MSDENNKIEVKVAGASLSAAGEATASISDAVGRVANYAADIFGIVGEPAGIVTDRLRVYRAKSAEKILERALEIVKENNRKIFKVHPKIGVPLLEYASLEDIEGENILELWSRLLASAPEEFDTQTRLCIDVLARLGPLEAQSLMEIVGDISRWSDDEINDLSRHNIGLDFSYVSPQKISTPLDGQDFAIQNIEFIECANKLRSLDDKLFIEEVSIFSAKGLCNSAGRGVNPSRAHNVDIQTIEALIQLNLIRRNEASFNISQSNELTQTAIVTGNFGPKVHFLAPTILGATLLRRVSLQEKAA